MRSTKIAVGSKASVESEATMLETVIEDVLKTSTMPAKQWLAMNPFPLAPLAIPTASGGQFHATQVGVDAAHRLTQRTRSKRQDLQQHFMPQEFDRLSFNAIGETILNIRAHLPANALPTDTVGESFYAALTCDYAVHLDALASQARQDIYRHVPCHLFQSDQGVPAFDVGPVAFRPRSDWITHFITDPSVRTYVDRVEAGSLSVEELGRQALESGSPKPLNSALSILRSLRGYRLRLTAPKIPY